MLKVWNLRKNFGSVRLLEGISFTLEGGSIMGVLGTHSISKTTFLRMLAGLSSISDGKVLVDRRPVSRAATRLKIGYMPRRTGVYRRISVQEFLEFFGAAYRMPRKVVASVIEDVLRLVDLLEVRNALTTSLSEEQLLKLAFGRILIHNPPLLLLDEPLDAFGPEGFEQFKAIVQELKAMGKSVLFTCLDPDVIRGFADLAAVLHRGRFVDCGPADEVLSRVDAHGWPPPARVQPFPWPSRPGSPTRPLPPAPAAPSPEIVEEAALPTPVIVDETGGEEELAEGVVAEAEPDLPVATTQSLRRAEEAKPVTGRWKPKEEEASDSAEASSDPPKPGEGGPAEPEQDDPDEDAIS